MRRSCWRGSRLRAPSSNSCRRAARLAEASSDRAIELLGELAELAKAVEAELEKAQRAAGTDA